MRASQPIPGNPWPHDMVIRTDEDSDDLLELLWVRAAWCLSPAGIDVPPPDLLPAIASSPQLLRRNKQVWEHTWAALWFATLAHHDDDTDTSATLQAVRSAAPSSPERLALLAILRGPSWRDEVDETPFDSSYQNWVSELAARSFARRHSPADADPLRQCLEELIRAWERGLTNLIAIPSENDYSRTVGQRTLLLTSATLHNQALLKTAISGFKRS